MTTTATSHRSTLPVLLGTEPGAVGILGIGLRTRHGQGLALLIAGQAGSGKTALAAKIIDHLDRLGHRTARLAEPSWPELREALESPGLDAVCADTVDAAAAAADPEQLRTTAERASRAGTALVLTTQHPRDHLRAGLLTTGLMSDDSPGNGLLAQLRTGRREDRALTDALDAPDPTRLARGHALLITGEGTAEFSIGAPA